MAICWPSCAECYQQEAVACYSTLSFIAGLDADTEYTIFVKDRHGSYHRQTVTTDSGGDFALDLTQFDDGMFTEFSGSYFITASLDPLVSVPETMTIGYTEYDCIEVKFLDIA